MCIQEYSSCVTFFFSQNDNSAGTEEGQEIQPFVVCAHAYKKIAHTHTDCKHHMPLLESEFEFLDAKAISVLSAHGVQPCLVSGSHSFGRTPPGALLWLHGCREHLEFPGLAESCKAGDPLALFLMGADSFTCCLDADTLEIPTELVFRAHLTSVLYPGDFHQALGERRIYYD